MVGSTAFPGAVMHHVLSGCFCYLLLHLPHNGIGAHSMIIPTKYAEQLFMERHGLSLGPGDPVGIDSPPEVGFHPLDFGFVL